MITGKARKWDNIHPHTLTSQGGLVTIFSNKTTFKMAAEPDPIQGSCTL